MHACTAAAVGPLLTYSRRERTGHKILPSHKEIRTGTARAPAMHAKQARPQQHARTRTHMRADHHANQAPAMQAHRPSIRCMDACVSTNVPAWLVDCFYLMVRRRGIKYVHLPDLFLCDGRMEGRH